jgi:hypothetical protein
VPLHNRPKRVFQRRQVQLSQNTKRLPNRVESVSRLKLIQKPETLLREGKNQIPIPSNALDRRR